MAHAETCPVCGGTGIVDKKIAVGGTVREITSNEDCHGCDGKGWVEVGRDDPPVVVPWGPYVPNPWPETHEPTINIGDWVYESGTYSANVEVVIKGF
jgi:hypothetical protein